MISAAQAKRDRKKLRAELAAELRRKDRAKLAELRERIKAARARRREAMREAVALCRSERAAVRERAKQRREAARARLRELAELEREQARGDCSARKAEVRLASGSEIGNVLHELASERSYQSELRHADKRRPIKGSLRSTRGERRRESDDEVRANLPPELVPVFDRVRAKIHGSDRRSRTEAFLHWAEEHPGEVVAIQSEDAERDVARMVREYEKHGRVMRKRSRYGGKIATLERELAAVPF